MKDKYFKKQYDIERIENLFAHVADILLIFFKKGLMELTSLSHDDTVAYNYLYTALELIQDGCMPDKLDTLMKCEFIDICRNYNPTSQDVLELVIVSKLIPYIQTQNLDVIYDMVIECCKGRGQNYFVDILYDYLSDDIKKSREFEVTEDMLKYSLNLEIHSKKYIE